MVNGNGHSWTLKPSDFHFVKCPHALLVVEWVFPLKSKNTTKQVSIHDYFNNQDCVLFPFFFSDPILISRVHCPFSRLIRAASLMTS